MPSDSHNSKMAKATDLIFLLFNVASAREMPFAIPLYMQCILHGLTTALLCVHSSLFTTKSFARDGFHLLRKSSVVATLITKVLFKQLLIRTAKSRVEHSW